MGFPGCYSPREAAMAPSASEPSKGPGKSEKTDEEKQREILARFRGNWQQKLDNADSATTRGSGGPEHSRPRKALEQDEPFIGRGGYRPVASMSSRPSVRTDRRRSNSRERHG